MTSEQPMPEIKFINGHTFIQVKDLADQWHTTTSIILNTGKPNQVPAKYRKKIDGHTWCDVEGLRYRLNMMKCGGKIPGQLNQFLERFPENGEHVDDSLGPQVETIMKNGSTIIRRRSFLQPIDYPSHKEIKVACDNKQVLWRYKNNRIQVLAQTLSNFLDTRTSSLLAVNKKQGVPEKFIHREWKVTWIDLEGLKQRVAHTEHGSALLKGLKQVIQLLDEWSTPDDLKVEAASAPQSCDPAVDERLRDSVYSLKQRVNRMEKRLDRIQVADKQAVQAMKEKRTPLDALNSRVSSMVTHTDRLDARTDGLMSRVSVLEDTSKWLSWSLATVLGLRFLGLMLRLLKRK